MAETETIRIAKMDEDERTIITILSPEERKEALLKAGQFKIQNANNRLLIKHQHLGDKGENNGLATQTT
ncbi:MAG TPA: hypothetical protein VKR06_46375 [Ktedonosporobacter sp.]|nr:hypothetical protein [Ktedonosporobacter sp.]